jgi:hypothetical protein
MICTLLYPAVEEGKMGTTDPSEEWKRLAALYTDMGDLELLELNDSFADLTEVAQSALEAELKKRQLWNAPSTVEPIIESPVRRRQSSRAQDLHLGGVTVREYDTLKEASIASYVLELAGIESVIGDGRGQFDLRSPFVRVAPHDAEKADSVLSQPVSPQILEDFEAMQNLPDFEVPACPQCSSEDVLLEACEPTNQWVCDHCGHSWSDAATPS